MDVFEKHMKYSSTGVVKMRIMRCKQCFPNFRGKLFSSHKKHAHEKKPYVKHK